MSGEYQAKAFLDVLFGVQLEISSNLSTEPQCPLREVGSDRRWGGWRCSGNSLEDNTAFITGIPNSLRSFGMLLDV